MDKQKRGRGRPKTLHGPCNYPGCERVKVGKGLCKKHLHRLWKNGTVELLGRKPAKVVPRCKVSTCNNPDRWSGYCGIHFCEFRRDGRIDGNGTGPNYNQDQWSFEDQQRLLSQRDNTPNHVGRAERGDIAYMADLLDRSTAACTTRLCILRKRRIAGLPVL